jgi:hypothetical protein
MTITYTVSPNIHQQINLAEKELAESSQYARVGEAILCGATPTVFTGRRPIAWVELNGFINPVGDNDTIRQGRNYIYTREELQKVSAEFNKPKSIIITTDSVHAAAIATGVLPPKKKELPKYDTSAILDAFKTSR